MKYRLLLIGSLLLIALMLSTPLVLAYSYYTTITVEESNGTSYDMLAMQVDIDNQGLADAGYMLSSALDTRVLEGADSIPHLVVSDRTLFATSITGSSSNDFDYTMGNSLLTGFYIVTGYGGRFTIKDDAAVEFGDEWKLTIYGWVDTTAGSNKDLWLKSGSLRVYVSGAGTITAEVTGGGTVSVSSVSSGNMLLELLGDGTDVRLYVDSTLEDTDTGSTVIDTSNDIIGAQYNVLPYGAYYRLWTR